MDDTWSGREDSNLQHRVPKARALAMLSYTPVFGPLGGFEPSSPRHRRPSASSTGRDNLDGAWGRLDARVNRRRRPRQAPTTLDAGGDQDMFLAGHPAPRDGPQDWSAALTPDPLRAAGSVAGLPGWFDPRSECGRVARTTGVDPACNRWTGGGNRRIATCAMCVVPGCSRTYGHRYISE